MQQQWGLQTAHPPIFFGASDSVGGSHSMPKHASGPLHSRQGTKKYEGIAGLQSPRNHNTGGTGEERIFTWFDSKKMQDKSLRIGRH